MKIDTQNNITLVFQEQTPIIELLKKLEHLHTKSDKNNIILIVTNLDITNTTIIAQLLKVSNSCKANKRSFVIVSNSINLELITEELIIVPSQQEAFDVIEMEEIERDLGF